MYTVHNNVVLYLLGTTLYLGPLRPHCLDDITFGCTRLLYSFRNDPKLTVCQRE